MIEKSHRVKQELEESIAEDLASTPVKVVVMGPDLANPSPAAKLRGHIISEAEAYGPAIKPEHRDLVRIASKALGKGHHLTVYEMHLVKISHLVVLIPDSPGSLCELGLFSAYREASQKLLILANKDYPRKGSYVADGPLAAAKHNQAEVRYLNYGDKGAAWSHVERRIHRIQAEQSMALLLARK